MGDLTLMDADKTMFSNGEDNIVIPIEHQLLVETRIKKAWENHEIMLDWDEVLKTLTQ